VLRFAGLGTELATYTLVCAGIGYLIDSARGHEKSYVTAFGTLIGFTLGMVRFIREVRKNIGD
jgi:F0F1-type ATP synthase assembly protein I